ncbi:glutathione S-transferase LANCL1 isoform X2 [Bombus impatiens]|uniref:Glutathione S-transferase LANCL1 isoform X2 n=1 Tax=Bombus impatiens TaxID=132113 RepID=A0A6P6FDL4_BOMIM|nr:glutathione S-transferase LANCL1 isoform X2 [Bombus impatiens]
MYIFRMMRQILTFSAGVTYKISREKSLGTTYINIINRFKHLICAKMDNRHYDNPFDDYPNVLSANVVNATTNEINEDYKETIKIYIKRLIDRLKEKKNHWTYNDDYSIYTGSAGIAYMFYKYGKCFNEPAYIDEAMELLRICPLALGAVVFHSKGYSDVAQNMISKVKSLQSVVLNESSDLPDELLYGRAGYLFSLLFLNSNISPAPIENDLIKQVIALIIKSGNLYSASRKYKTPLMYVWHGSEYIGGAHGLGGILYILLQAQQYLTQTQLQKDIKPALDFLQNIRYPSGNFPSSIGSHTDKLIHWCHGAPGMTMLFCLAYEIYKDKNYLTTAVQCGEVIWSRGLLKKGYGICHGVAGNAYTFLSLFQQTKDIKYLYRACKFAEWCMDYGTHQSRSPDRPFSLFEGLAGTIYFLIDLQHPLSAKFPAYST